MTLQDAMKAIEDLSIEELRALRSTIDEREQEIQSSLWNGMTPAERVRQLDEALALFREGLTEEQLAEMTEAMNAEYIEPWDEAEWKE